MRVNTDKRKEYWERDYLKYWEDRVASDSKNVLTKKDTSPPDLSIFLKYYHLARRSLDKKPKKILDVGIGFGRFVPVYKEDFDNNIWGTDISENMIRECKRLYPEIKGHLIVSPAESQPFPPNSFPFIVCWAVFDATYQNQALWEFQRLLKKGGVVMLTGKNSQYLLLDSKALTAERRARKKGHPNYFTKVSFLEKNIYKFGFQIEKLFRFRKRGDFSKNCPAKKRVSRFYEYVMILKKIKTMRKKPPFIIADKVSETFKKRYG